MNLQISTIISHKILFFSIDIATAVIALFIKLT